MAGTEFRESLNALGIAQVHIARLFHTNPRNVRRWLGGTRRVPAGIDIVLRLLAAKVVTIAEIEQVAAPISVRTNGDARPELPAPLLGEPAPKPPVLAPAEPVPLADPGLTTSEKVVALELGVCHWPHGDPGRPDFYFCGRPAAGGSYCEEHHIRAYVTWPAGRKRGTTALPRRSVLSYRR
jgi:hypothetical protein